MRRNFIYLNPNPSRNSSEDIPVFFYPHNIIGSEQDVDITAALRKALHSLVTPEFESGFQAQFRWFNVFHTWQWHLNSILSV
jgi:hypothetical protein